MEQQGSPSECHSEIAAETPQPTIVVTAKTWIDDLSPKDQTLHRILGSMLPSWKDVIDGERIR